MSKVSVYDDFDAPGYSLASYEEKWSLPYGLGEMDLGDTRRFEEGCFVIDAVPFQTTSDVSVNDHLKYMAVSTQAFSVPAYGTLVLSSDVRADTSGTVPDLIQEGIYGPSGTWLDPANPPTPPEYRARLLQGQQAAVVVNVLDFCTGQLFDWFVSSDRAFALIERLPTTLTGNVSNPECGEATEVGTDQMYTQIVLEISAKPNEWHHLDIALTRHGGKAWIDYFFDHTHVARVADVGVPLDRQGVPFTGTYPSLGPGEQLAKQLSKVRFGHGLFSLVDAFPFQHPGVPELSVSIPAISPASAADAGRARLFGQGARGSFDNFTTLTIGEGIEPALPSDIVKALASAKR